MYYRFCLTNQPNKQNQKNNIVLAGILQTMLAPAQCKIVFQGGFVTA